MRHLRNAQAQSEPGTKAGTSGPFRALTTASVLFGTITAGAVAGLAFHCLHRCQGRGKSSLVKMLRLLLLGPVLLVVAIAALCVAVPSWWLLRFISPKSPRPCRNCGETEAAEDSDLCRACVEVNAIESVRGPAVLDHLETDMAQTTEKWLPPTWLSVPLENGQSMIVARHD
jgi:hypothetical protein